MSPGGGEFGNDSRLVSPYAPLAVTIPALLKRYGLTRLSDLDDFLRRLFEESYGRRLEAIHKIKIPRIAALVDTDAGPCFLRVFEAEVGAEWLEFQMQVVDAIRGADIPSPTPIVTSANANYFNFRGFYGFLTEAAAGQPFVPGNHAQLASAGRLLARVHMALAAMPFKFRGRWERESHFADSIRQGCEPMRLQLQRMKVKFRALEFAAAFELLKKIEDAVGRFNDELPYGLIHGDFRADNLFFRDAEISAFFDFDWTGYAQHSRDLCWAAINFNQWSSEYILTPAESETLLGRYLSTISISRPEQEFLPIGIGWNGLVGLTAAANRIENGLKPSREGVERTLAILVPWLASLPL